MEAVLVAAFVAMIVSGTISYYLAKAKMKNQERASTRKDTNTDIRIEL